MELLLFQFSIKRMLGLFCQVTLFVFVK